MRFSTWFATGVDWVDGDEAMKWPVTSGGLGPREDFNRVETEVRASGLRLHGEFDLGARPESLWLALRADAGAFEVHLNGDRVLEADGSELPEPDRLGFRHFDLTSAVGRLVEHATNRWAIGVEGTRATPVVYGDFTGEDGPALWRQPGDDDLLEKGESASVYVRAAEFDRLVQIRRDGSNGVAKASDVEFVIGGVVVERDATVSPWDSTWSFRIDPVPGEVIEIEVRARNDVHAEADEYFVVRYRGESLRFRIPRNDTAVVRTRASGEGTLHQALENAGYLPGFDLVVFSDAEGVPFSTQPVTLVLDPTRALPHFVCPVEIAGPPLPGRVVIEAAGAAVFEPVGLSRTAPNGFALRRIEVRNAERGVSPFRYTGDVMIEDCEFVGCEYGVAANAGGGAIEIRRCTFEGSGRRAISAYSQEAGGSVRIEECTVFGGTGAGIRGGGSLLVDGCTIVASGSSSIDLRFPGSALRNSIIAGGEEIQLINPENDFGGNVIEHAASPDGWHPDSLVGTRGDPVDPKLGPLTHNGGFVRTIALLDGSPALDRGVGGAAAKTDARGDGFTRVVGLAQDAGAFERQLTGGDLELMARAAASYEATGGLYYQVAVLVNRSPWELGGVALTPVGLPGGVELFNGSAEGVLEVETRWMPGAPKVVVLQYRADRPDLLIDPEFVWQPVVAAGRAAVGDCGGLDSVEVFGGGRKIVIVGGAGRSGLQQLEVSGDLTTWSAAGPPKYLHGAAVAWVDRRHGSGWYYRLVGLE